jgi:glycosyltransferase involved in cell wall biosynthesis
LLRVAAETQADLIWLSFSSISYPLLHYIKAHSRFPVVADTDSVWSRFVLRGAPYASTAAVRAKIEAEGHAKEAEERAGVWAADLTTAVSEVDAEYYRGFARSPRRVQVFANVIDLEAYRTPPPPAPDLTHPNLFLGGTFWPGSPMEEAARWVMAEVLPLVLQRRPEVQLNIVGKGADHVLCDVQHPAVTVHGLVPSVLPYLSHAQAALVPLHFESGTRFKILEAGACGVPVVSTTLGAEGLPVGEDHALIADEPAAFADAILRLLNDQATAGRLAANLRALVARDYGLATLVAQGRVILNELALNVGRTNHRWVF